MKYNSTLDPLPIPEYGRNVQNMVELCKNIQDRKERNICAQTIIGIIGGMFPERKSPEDNNKTLWDHLAIMAKFELDIDYPVEIVHSETLASKPEHISYPENDIIYRHYGHIIQRAIEQISAMPRGEERDYFTLLIANQMKRSYMAWNGKNVDDYTIFKELYELSNGVLELRESEHKLTTSSGTFPGAVASKNKNKQNQKKKKK